MKDSKKSHVGYSNKPADGKKKGAGNKGLATAPMPPISAEGRIGRPQKVGLGPLSLAFAPLSKHATPDTTAAPLVPKKHNMPIVSKVSDLAVCIAGGDDGELYYVFEAPGRTVAMPSKLVVESRMKVMGDLGRVGILAVSAEAKAEVSRRIEAAEQDDGIIVATRIGYEKSSIPRYYIYGDGTLISPLPDIRVVPLVRDNGRFAAKGDLAEYEADISKIIKNQPVPITLFFFALTPVLKPFVANAKFKAENMILELVGDTSTFKSALTCTLAGTIWGAMHASDGYARSWNMSENAIEGLLPEFNDHLLILDEATLAHSNEKQRAERILNIVHRLSSGQGRERPDVATQSHSVSMLSNSNQPMRAILSAANIEEVRKALEVRLISFQLAKGKPDFFNAVPAGFNSVPAAMTHLFEAANRNYGVLARAFILATLQMANSDISLLTRLIQKEMSKFIRKAGVSTIDNKAFRRAQAFALASAAAAIAFETGVLNKPLWGKVNRAIREAWNDHGAIIPSFAGDPNILAYMCDGSHVFADARVEKPQMSDDEFEKIAGFIFRGANGELCLAVPEKAKHRLGLSPAALKQMKLAGVLRSGRKLQSKLKLRRWKLLLKRDVFYVFRIKDVPTETNITKSRTTA